jgi:PST family polysaccharide transporter
LVSSGRDREVAAGSAASASEDLHGPRSVGRQALWNYLAFGLSKSATLIMTVVLARILGPEEFGQFALALLVLTFFDFVRDLGVAGALVHHPGPWARIAGTGLTLTVVLGVIMALVAVWAAPLSAALLGDSTLAPLVQVLALSLLISACGTLPQSMLRRRVDFRGRVWPEFTGATAKASLAIALAANGYGVWSLVFAQLAASLTTTVGYWLVARPRLEFGFDPRAAGALLRYGLPLSLVSFLSFVIYNVDYAAIGRRLGNEELGYYTLAYRLPELIVLNLCVVVGEVLFSALSRLQHDRPAMIAKSAP